MLLKKGGDYMKEECMKTTMLGEKAYRLKHIAHNLDRSIETIRRHVRSDKLKAYRVGGEYYVIESDLKKYLKGGG